MSGPRSHRPDEFGDVAATRAAGGIVRRKLVAIIRKPLARFGLWRTLTSAFIGHRVADLPHLRAAPNNGRRLHLADRIHRRRAAGLTMSGIRDRVSRQIQPAITGIFRYGDRAIAFGLTGAVE